MLDAKNCPLRSWLSGGCFLFKHPPGLPSGERLLGFFFLVVFGVGGVDRS
jgi:hypothetical protein